MTDLASLLTDHMMSGRPIRAKDKHFRSICIRAEYIPSFHGQEMMWVRQYPHILKKIVFDERTYKPNSVPSPIQVLMKRL